MATQAKNMTGMRFGKLTVERRASNPNGTSAMWWCICDCGNRTTALGVQLRQSLVKSCGCVRKALKESYHGAERLNYLHKSLDRLKANKSKDEVSKLLKKLPHWVK